MANGKGGEHPEALNHLADFRIQNKHFYMQLLALVGAMQIARVNTENRKHSPGTASFTHANDTPTIARSTGDSNPV